MRYNSNQFIQYQRMRQRKRRERERETETTKVGRDRKKIDKIVAINKIGDSNRKRWEREVTTRIKEDKILSHNKVEIKSIYFDLARPSFKECVERRN